MVNVLLSGVALGAVYGLLSCAFVLAYWGGGYFNFGIAGCFTLGAYFSITAVGWGLPEFIAVAVGTVLAAASWALVEWQVIGRMRRRGMAELALMVSSLGVYMVMEAAVAMAWGSGIVSIRGFLPGRTVVLTPGITVSGGQAAAVLGACIAFGLVVGTTFRTRLGVRIRAIAEDRDLAAGLGIPVERQLLYNAAMVGLLAGLAGALFVLDHAVKPTAGFAALLFAAGGLLVGGTRALWAAALGALALATLGSVFGFVASSIWREALTFGVVAVSLVCRNAIRRGTGWSI